MIENSTLYQRIIGKEKKKSRDNYFALPYLNLFLPPCEGFPHPAEVVG